MTHSKIIEIRDDGTFIPAIAHRITRPVTNYEERWLLRRAGWDSIGDPIVFLHILGSGRVEYDPHRWDGITMTTAHEYIKSNWDSIEPGQVICCEFIRGERSEPKTSERGE